MVRNYSSSAQNLAAGGPLHQHQQHKKWISAIISCWNIFWYSRACVCPTYAVIFLYSSACVSPTKAFVIWYTAPSTSGPGLSTQGSATSNAPSTTASSKVPTSTPETAEDQGLFLTMTFSGPIYSKRSFSEAWEISVWRHSSRRCCLSMPWNRKCYKGGYSWERKR